VALARVPAVGASPLGLLERNAPRGLYWGSIVLLCLAAVVLALTRARRSSEVERRRLRVFLAGLALGVVPILVQVLLEVVSERYSRFADQPAFRMTSSIVFLTLLASVPFTTAYAIVANRVLDVRIILRRALQYALARAALMALVAVPFALVLRDLYIHRAEPLSATLSGGRGLLTGSVAVLGLVLLSVRQTLLSWLDVVFARGSRPLADVLLDLSRELRAAPDSQELVRRIGEELRRGLGVESVHLLLRRGATLEPLDAGVRPLGTDSACWSLAQHDSLPLLVEPEERTSLYALLPPDDQSWVVDAAVSLLVPVAGAEGAAAGLLALGPKRSGEAWSRQDRALVVTLAGSLSMALESERRRGLPAPAQGGLTETDEPARQCEPCRRVHPPGTSLCTCGGATVPAVVPHTLQGKFRIDEMIGKGGMGVVYRAVDLTLDREVAVKTLPRLGTVAALRLRREARAMASVEHPNLARIWGAESWRGTPILVLEFLSGGTLAQKLLAGPMPIPAALSLGQVLASALGCMHAAGLLHRDIKPSNIGFSADGSPKLLDFGLARIGDGWTRPHGGAPGPQLAPEITRTTVSLDGRIVGTPLYLSPEALAGETADPACDLWSLSVVLYEAIAGVHPFQAPTVREVFARIASADAADMRRWRPDCPASLAAFFADSLSRRRDRRPRTTGQVTERLLSLGNERSAASRV
jgi:hypothetical protein